MGCPKISPFSPFFGQKTIIFRIRLDFLVLEISVDFVASGRIRSDRSKKLRMNLNHFIQLKAKVSPALAKLKKIKENDPRRAQKPSNE